MTFSEEQVMLTFAALSYRGFQDALIGTLHDESVRDALLDGLNTFEPARDQWELVWGPATTRHVPLKAVLKLDIFDWSSMFVVRHRTARNKYVIAIRGTNPFASQDWLFGDLWVGTVVQWPYTNDGAAISTSTALGLAALQGLSSGPPPAASGSSTGLPREMRNAIRDIAARAQIAMKGFPGQAIVDKAARVEQQVTGIAQHWLSSIADLDAVRSQLQRLNSLVIVEPRELRLKLQAEAAKGSKLDILTFLKTQADDTSEALDISVTGHSKGGALAPTFALWLKEALGSDQTECWDTKQKAHVGCYAFAGPTPGNAAFADRIDQLLDQDCHQTINTNDIVPHAFDVDDLADIPALYQNRTAALAPLVENLIKNVRPLAYKHPKKGVKKFAGKLDANRLFALEFVYQHLDAYLAELGLLSEKMNAFTSFV